jgi:hypothetical protein
MMTGGQRSLQGTKQEPKEESKGVPPDDGRDIDMVGENAADMHPLI